jgi:ornithine carbamoyltransferase
MKDLLRTADLTAPDLEELLSLSAAWKKRPDSCPQALAGATVVLYFALPSTRTRLSFEAAVTRLGGAPVSVGLNELQLGRGETIEDTARVVSRYARAFVIRAHSHRDVARFAAAASIPVINALSALHHPMQSLADLLTMRERFGSLQGLPVAYLGDGSNVAHSLLEAAGLAGLDLRMACPPGYQPHPEVVDVARTLAAASGGSCRVLSDPHEAVKEARVVYTDVWVSMGTSDSEREQRLRELRAYQVNDEVMSVAAPGAIFMHCLPAHRDEEVSTSVMEGPNSVVFDQAENRLHTAVAVLFALAEETLTGQRVG